MRYYQQAECSADCCVILPNTFVYWLSEGLKYIQFLFSKQLFCIFSMESHWPLTISKFTAACNADTLSGSVFESTNYNFLIFSSHSFCHTETQSNLFKIRLLLTMRAILQLPHFTSAMWRETASNSSYCTQTKTHTLAKIIEFSSLMSLNTDSTAVFELLSKHHYSSVLLLTKALSKYGVCVPFSEVFWFLSCSDRTCREPNIWMPRWELSSPWAGIACL